jgi:SAM-dependent methyltransferase
MNTTVFCDHYGRTIRRCCSCNLLFEFPQPDAADLHQQFQSDYFVKGRPSGGTRLDLEFEEWRRPALSRIVAEILKLKNGGRLLDVGCASGELFTHFLDGNWQIYGVEPSALAFQKANERFGNDARVRLFNNYLSEIELEKGSFDVITVLESLYYMPDPRQELSRLSELLKDDGVLAIAVPGYEYQRLRHSRPMSYLFNGHGCSLTSSHLFYFSFASMGELLAKYGFRISDVVQLGSSSYGSGLRRLTQTTYVQLAGAVSALTLGQLRLAPHILYLCRKSQQN